MTTRAARIGLVSGLVALAVAVGAAVWWAGRGDDERADITGSTTTTTDEPSGSTTTTPPPTNGADTTVIWPAPGSAARFATAPDAARSFAVDFLRFEDPVIGAFQQGDSRSGEVPIRAAPNGPVTTILVRQVGSGTAWSVLGAVTENIEVTRPSSDADITSPVTVEGRAIAFEGNVEVEVREVGEAAPIGEGFVTGGGDAVRPFEGQVSFETPGTPTGVLVFFTSSAEDGRVWEATTVRVAFRSTDIDAAACGTYRSPRLSPGDDEMEVKAYFTCSADTSATAEPRLHPIYRLAPKSSQVLRAALEALLAGPTDDERDAKLTSFFSNKTEGMLRSVTVTDAHAIVDFDDLRPVIPNASSSAGSEQLLGQLDATVFQFRTVESVEYRIEGSCTDFNEWLQFGGCDRRTRSASSD